MKGIAVATDRFEDAPRYTGGGQIKELPGLPKTTDGFEKAPRYAGSGRLLQLADGE